MGIMFILVWKMRQQIDFQKSRSLIQALLAQQGAQDESIKKVYEDLTEAFFPFDKNQKSADLKKMRDAMSHWIAQGPVIMEPMDDGSSKRKLASRLAQGQKNLADRLTLQKEGKIMEMDPFQRAKQRNRGSAS